MHMHSYDHYHKLMGASNDRWSPSNGADRVCVDNAVLYFSFDLRLTTSTRYGNPAVHNSLRCPSDMVLFFTSRGESASNPGHIS